MDKLLEILQDLPINPAVSFIVVLVIYILQRLKSIEEYLSYRTLRKYEQYLNATTDHALKKLLNKRRDQEILFKLTKIPQTDLSMQIMKLLTHNSLVLYKRDLDYYRFKLYLVGRDVFIHPLNWFDKLSCQFLKLLALCCVLFSCFTFIILLIKLWVDPINIIFFRASDMPVIIKLILYTTIFLYWGLFFLTETPKSNENKMKELLKAFNDCTD